VTCVFPHTSCLFASTASTFSLLSGCACSDHVTLQAYLSEWSSRHGALPDTHQSKEPFWDRPGVLADKAVVKFSLTLPSQSASFLAAPSPHSGDWLFALPIASCGLRLDDEAIRIVVALRLGLHLCVPQPCHCGSLVDARGLHSYVCKRAPGRSARHHALNDLIARAFVSVGILATKTPPGLSRTDVKRPDGLTLIQ